MNKHIKYIIGLGAISVFLFCLSIISSGSKPVEASVSQGSEYQATTTGPATGFNVAPAVFTAKQGNGTLGSVIITQTAAGIITIYDATTSDVTQRSGATSTLRVLASFGASPTMGTYTFDEVFFNGLLVSSVGAQGTSTVTYR